MLLNLSWLIPGAPIISSILITVLLLSFSKTMNRLTKPVSYFMILSIVFSEIIDFILLRNNISGNERILGVNFELVVDNPAILFAGFIGLFFLLLMLFSVTKLQRRNGYVRYFIFLGFLSGLLYLFSFSGSPFSGFYDPLISSLDGIGIPF